MHLWGASSASRMLCQGAAIRHCKSDLRCCQADACLWVDRGTEENLAGLCVTGLAKGWLPSFDLQHLDNLP